MANRRLPMLKIKEVLRLKHAGRSHGEIARSCGIVHSTVLGYLRRWRAGCSLTLVQLRVEYKEQHPAGYQYSQFCEHYRRWLGKRDYVMREGDVAHFLIAK